MYASRVGDPFDWLFFQDDPGSPFATNANGVDIVGAPVTALMTHTDDYLFMASREAIFILRGDPSLIGGSIRPFVPGIGVLSKGAWCSTPFGDTLFLSDDGLYRIPAGAAYPQSLSAEVLPEDLRNIDPEKIDVLMQYDIEGRGVHIYLVGDSDFEDMWFDWQTRSFWPVKIRDEMGPTALRYPSWTVAPIQTPIGCVDGLIRNFQPQLPHDRGFNRVNHPIPNHVVYGLLNLGGDSGLRAEVMELGAVVDVDVEQSVKWELFVDETNQRLEKSLKNGSPFATGEWDGDRNYRSLPQAAGQSGALRLSGTGRWSVEEATMKVRRGGRFLKL